MSNSNSTNSELQETLLQILDDERKRISLDLHDSVQNKLHLLRDKYLGMHPDFAADMKSVLEEVRRVAYQLIPKHLQTYSLSEYLNIYATTLQQTYSRQFRVDYQTNVGMVVPKKVEAQLFRIVQESFNNVLKYAAHTPIVFIRYLHRGDDLVLIVQDMGDGFDLDVALQVKGTNGLNGIITRSQIIGAQCHFDTGHLAGCKVKITLPIAILSDFEADELQNLPSTDPYVLKKRLSNEIKHILIVDNQPEYGAFLQKLIQNTFEGIIVVYEKSAAAARKYLEEIDYQSDVIITDITMPDESGIKMIKTLRKIEAAKDLYFMIYSINDNPSYIFQVCKVLNIKTYVWKEEVYDYKHPIIEALENLDKGYMSPKIATLAQCFDKKTNDLESDSLNRKIFKTYLKLQREIYCESNSTKTLKKDRARFLQLVKEALGGEASHIDAETIDKYYRKFLRAIGFDKNAEAHHSLLRFSKDLDL